MVRARPRSRLRAVLLLSAPLALWMGCFPNLEGAQCETDQNCPSTQFCSSDHVCKEGARPARAATLSATASLGASSTASVGQTLTLTFTVTNTGNVLLEDITPTSVTAGGTAAGTILSGPSPANSARLLPNESATFTYSVTSGAAGSLTFTVSAQSTASDNGVSVTASATTPAVTVQRPAALQVSLSGPTTISRGQAFTVTMTVTNTGDAAAQNVAPGTPTVAQTGGAAATAGTAPSAVTIDGGATATFQLPFTESGTSSGTLTITADASGRDGNTGAALSATPGSSNAITVQTAASLRISSFTIPTLIGRGGPFTATLTVTNDGEAAANAVLPSPDPPSPTATGGVSATTSTPAQTAGNIPGGGSRTFTWSYTENGTAPGTLLLTAGATGTDANSGQTVTAPAVRTNTASVQTGGALAVTGFGILPTLSRGQAFSVVMVVMNSGGATVDGVVPAPIPPTLTKTGSANATTATTTFTPVSLAAGASHTFTFNYTETDTGPGTLAFTGHATGIDAATGNPVDAADVTTNVATVQQPAALSITGFSLPANLSQGQAFQLSLMVQNVGQATALSVLPSPSPPSLSATGGANAGTGTVPMAQDIPGGASATFTWSYVESGSGVGTLRFSAAVSGTDANSGGTVSTASTNSNTAQVVPPAALSATWFTVPSAVLRGATFSAVMRVTNTGGAPAVNVIPSPSPPTVTPTGSAAASSSTTVSAVTIPPGGSSDFTWSFTENGTDVGTLVLSAGVTGSDGYSNTPLSVAALSSSPISVQNPGGLTITDYSLSRAQLSRGQQFTVNMTVQNNGGSAVNGVAPTPLQPVPDAGGTQANAFTSTTPASANIAAGATHTFTWTYTENGTGPGTLAFTAQAQGTGSVSGNTITSPPATTATATVQTPATLVVTAADLSGPAKVSRGQQFTVQMVVTNTGQATAMNVAPLTAQPTVQVITGTAGATSGATVASQNIAGGTSATFQWTFTENGGGTGTLKFTEGAAGTDANSGATVTAPAVQSQGTTTVQTPAQLSITSFTQPSVILRGTIFTLSLAVANAGEADAIVVLPSPNPPAQNFTGSAHATTSSSQAAVTIPGLGNHTFSWSYTEDGSGPGALQFTASATGTDANSLASLSTSPANSNTATVQDPAILEITAFTLPPSLSVGQTFNASLTVHNRGGTTAINVLPSPNPPTLNGTGGATASTSTSLTAATLAPGGSQTFTWAYTESGGPGTIQLQAGATGTDTVSSATVTAPAATSNTSTVQSPAALAVTSFTLSRSTIDRGQSFTASMTVSNSGQATATNVSPTPLRPNLVVVSGAASAATSDSPPAQNIPGGQSATFTWSYTENGAGPGVFKLNGGAQGMDANNGATVSAAAVDTSGNVTVQTPPQLQITSFTASPTPILRGSGFTLTLIVTNTGQATANAVAPSQPVATQTGGANATTTTTQTPLAIPGGNSATFSWSYTENGTAAGTLAYATQVTGTDANTGGALSVNANSNVVTVQEPASLIVQSFFTTRTTLTRGQSFTATMIVKNLGGTTAMGVLPNPDPPTVNVVSGGAHAVTTTTQTAVDIAGGASQTFTWSYIEDGTASGGFSLTAAARGTSAIGGSTVDAPSETTSTVTVQTAPILTVTSFTIPLSITRGTTFTATMTVANTGETTANNVLPSPLHPTVTTAGSANAATTTNPPPQDIAGGSQATFSWTYTENGTGSGNLTLNGGAVGTDTNTGNVVTAAAVDSNQGGVPLKLPPDPGVTLAVSPRVAEVGSTVTVTMEVKNGGSQPLRTAPPEVLKVDGPGEVELVSAPMQTAATRPVEPGQTQTFEWTYRAARFGWVTFSGAAKGTAQATSRHLTVPAPWCASATSLLASAGSAWSGHCGATFSLGGSPSATGGAGLYRYEWTPEDGLSNALEANPTAAPKVASTDYALTVTDADGCQARDAARAQVTDAPVVTVAAEGGAAPGDPVRFTRALSCPAGGCADAWDLGDGRTSTLASPVTRYSTEGARSVTYRTADANGCEAIAVLPLAVGAP